MYMYMYMSSVYPPCVEHHVAKFQVSVDDIQLQGGGGGGRGGREEGREEKVILYKHRSNQTKANCKQRVVWLATMIIMNQISGLFSGLVMAFILAPCFHNSCYCCCHTGEGSPTNIT